GLCQGLRSRCSTPRVLRGVRSSTQMTEAIVPSAMLRARASSGSSSTRWHRIDSPRLTQRVARLWLNGVRVSTSRPARVARGSARRQAGAERGARGPRAAGQGGAGLGAAGGDGLEREAVVGGLAQDDGAALGVEDGDGVVEDGLEQVLFLLDVDEVVPGAEQG